MTTERLREWLGERLRERGFEPAGDKPDGDKDDCAKDELLELLLDWLKPEADRCEADGENAITLGVKIYELFNVAFTVTFYSEHSPGRAWVEKRLRKRGIDHVSRPLEVVLARIYEQRMHLLRDLFTKHQKSLFADLAIDPSKLNGYFRNVARIESYKHRDDQDRLGNAIHGVDSDTFVAPPTDSDEDDPPVSSPVPVSLLTAFWSEENGFTDDQIREGLINLWQVRATDKPELADRCAELMRAKFPNLDDRANELDDWANELARLRRKISKLLARLEEVQGRLAELEALQGRPASMAVEGERILLQEVEKCLSKVEETRRELARHEARLRPRPAEIDDLLKGEVKNASSVRHKRIQKEIKLLRSREARGRDQLLQLAPADLATVAHLLRLDSADSEDQGQDLLARMSDHLGEPLEPTGTQGIGEAERDRRKQALQEWERRGDVLAGEIRFRLWHLRRVNANDPKPEVRDLLRGWLADAEDLLELGLRTGEGVIGGIGHRFGWRLERLLRIGCV